MKLVDLLAEILTEVVQCEARILNHSPNEIGRKLQKAQKGPNVRLVVRRRFHEAEP